MGIVYLMRFVSSVSPIYYNNTGMQWRDLKKPLTIVRISISKTLFSAILFG